MKNRLLITGAIFLTMAVYAGHLAVRASRDRVTLDVQNASIESVVRSMRWQTWEKILFDKKAEGRITLAVENMPLDQVLQMVSEQVQLRWTKVYPIYLRKESLSSLERAMRGEIKFSESKFTNFQSRPFGPGAGGDFGMGGRGFGGNATNMAGTVSLVLSNKDLIISALALSRASRAQVVPENGYQPKVNLELDNVPFEEALDQIASQSRRSWTRLYALLPNQGGPGGGRSVVGGSGPVEARPRPERSGSRSEELLETLPPAERQLAELRQQERLVLASLSPEQRDQVMAERMNNPEIQQRAEQRQVSNLRNTTPEQRRDRYERMYQMRKARAAVTPSQPR